MTISAFDEQPVGAVGEWSVHDADAYQRFLGASRGFWSNQLFQALQRQIEHAPDSVSLRAPDAEFAAFVAQHPTHRIFAWLERHLQRMKYSGPFGLVESTARDRNALLEALAKPLPQGMLRLDPELKMPGYYNDYDIHQHPGGLGGDPLAGYIYRDAAATGVVSKPKLHERFARLATGDRHVTRVLDLGCGYGKSTWAFAAAAPCALVQGIDVSASCLEVAAHDTPVEIRSRVTFAQVDAVSSGLPAGSYDMVTSTMLLHEMPEDAIRALITETARLVAPGGVVVHLDFLPPADRLRRFLFAGHSRRNNEPFLLDHSRIDLRDAYARAGFHQVSTIEFAEEGGALDPAMPKWRLPWTMIVAEK